MNACLLLFHTFASPFFTPFLLLLWMTNLSSRYFVLEFLHWRLLASHFPGVRFWLDFILTFGLILSSQAVLALSPSMHGLARVRQVRRVRQEGAQANLRRRFRLRR